MEKRRHKASESDVRKAAKRGRNVDAIKEEKMRQWTRTVLDWFPNLHTQTYFIPPFHFNRVRYVTRDLPNAPPTKVQQPIPQLSDVRETEVLQRVRGAFSRLWRDQSEPMMVIVGLDFDSYLNSPKPTPSLKKKGHGPQRCVNIEITPKSDPISLVDEADNSMFVRPRDLSTGCQRGTFDTLILHKRLGLIICEIKAVGDLLQSSFASISPESELEVAKRKLQKSLQQLNKEEQVLRHLIGDLLESPPITKVLILPNLKRTMAKELLNQDDRLKQEFTYCFQTDWQTALQRCIFSEQLPPVGRTGQEYDDVIHNLHNDWWRHLIDSTHWTRPMTDDTYQALVARFCGPGTSQQVMTSFQHRVDVTTLHDAVLQTSRCMQDVILTPQQVDLLQAQDPRVMLTGPPGTGKTAMLVLKAALWLSQGHRVILASLWTGSLAASQYIYTQLVKQNPRWKDRLQLVHSTEPDFSDLMCRLLPPSPCPCHRDTHRQREHQHVTPRHDHTHQTEPDMFRNEPGGFQQGKGKSKSSVQDFHRHSQLRSELMTHDDDIYMDCDVMESNDVGRTAQNVSSHTHTINGHTSCNGVSADKTAIFQHCAEVHEDNNSTIWESVESNKDQPSRDWKSKQKESKSIGFHETSGCTHFHCSHRPQHKQDPALSLNIKGRSIDSMSIQPHDTDRHNPADMDVDLKQCGHPIPRIIQGNTVLPKYAHNHVQRFQTQSRECEPSPLSIEKGQNKTHFRYSCLDPQGMNQPKSCLYPRENEVQTYMPPLGINETKSSLYPRGTSQAESSLDSLGITQSKRSTQQLDNAKICGVLPYTFSDTSEHRLCDSSQTLHTVETQQCPCLCCSNPQKCHYGCPQLSSDSKPFKLIIDEVPWFSPKFLHSLDQTIPNAHIWAASSTRGTRTKTLKEIILVQNLRSPPVVVREMEKSYAYFMRNTLKYASLDSGGLSSMPPLTDGPPVKKIDHSRHVHPRRVDVWECRQCGADLASFLKQDLGIKGDDTHGQSRDRLRFSDVIISGHVTLHDDVRNNNDVINDETTRHRDETVTENSPSTTQTPATMPGFLQGLSDNAIRFETFKKGDVDDVEKLLSPQNLDAVLVASPETVLGLEKPVVVVIGTSDIRETYPRYVDPRLDVIACCTSQLVLVGEEEGSIEECFYEKLRLGSHTHSKVWHI